MDATAVAERVGVDYGSTPTGNDPKTIEQYMYWRMPDGSINRGGAWPHEFMRLSQKGWVPLPRYGTFLDDTWREYERDPLFLLLQRGGHRELAPRQILESLLGKYRHPATRVLDRERLLRDFPQLATVAWREVSCQFCPLTLVDCAEAGLNGAHDLHRHERIAHKETSQQQALGRHLADALTGRDESTAGILQALAEGQRQIAETLAALAVRIDLVERQQGPSQPKAAKGARR